MPYPVNGILWEVHKWPYLRMRSENMAKIALNALRLRKFEPVNGKSWSPAFGSLWLASSLKLAARCPVSGCWPSCFFCHMLISETRLRRQGNLLQTYVI